MMPFLTYPLALIGAVALPALAAIYLMHNRFRVRPVSSLFLWEAVTRSREGGVRIRRVRAPWLFFLELMVLALLVLAAVDPRWLARKRRNPLVVILDNSVSMNAHDGTSTSRERALAALADELRSLRPSSVRLIRAGLRPEVLGPPRPPEALSSLLRRWDGVAPEADLDRSLQLAAEISGPRTRFLVLTDHAPGSALAPGLVRWVSRGRALPNAGIVNAARSSGKAGLDRCLFEIANPTRVPVRTRFGVEARGSGAAPIVQELLLKPGERRRVIMEIPASAEVVVGTLATDALAADNTAWLLSDRPARVRVRFGLRDENLRNLVSEAVRASGLLAPEGGTPQLVLTDREDPASRIPGCWTLRLKRPAETRGFIGPFVIDREHPLARGLDLRGAIWGAGEGRSGRGYPVIAAGNHVLLSDREMSAGKHLIEMTLDPDASTIQGTPNWPILFWNLLRWRADTLPGFAERHVRLGRRLVFNLPPTGAANAGGGSAATGPRATALDPGGKPLSVSQARGTLSFEPLTVGLHEVRLRARTFRAAVNLFAPGETDLSTCGSGTSGEWHTSESLRKEYAGTSGLLAGVVLAMMVWHSFLLYGKKET